jgi:hypothetical protein
LGLSSNYCCPCLFFRDAARCLALAREELGALRRRAGLPRSHLRGTFHVASDIPGPVEQPGGLRGHLDPNGDGSAELSYPLPDASKRLLADPGADLLHEPDLVFEPAVREELAFRKPSRSMKAE